jgi:hypothetical protein
MNEYEAQATPETVRSSVSCFWTVSNREETKGESFTSAPAAEEA